MIIILLTFVLLLRGIINEEFQNSKYIQNENLNPVVLDSIKELVIEENNITNISFNSTKNINISNNQSIN